MNTLIHAFLRWYLSDGCPEFNYCPCVDCHGPTLWFEAVDAYVERRAQCCR